MLSSFIINALIRNRETIDPRPKQAISIGGSSADSYSRQIAEFVCFSVTANTLYLFLTRDHIPWTMEETKSSEETMLWLGREGMNTKQAVRNSHPHPWCWKCHLPTLKLRMCG
ncbi:hypothetical protein SAY86_005167 [Trapa natans]|uniref:Uncharacterized protein n=1 Tax=Trapa natans TaxID=22666 RepID=A0AAN7QR64_TRANT|nr:hypothetical protein SAY86_005167 [Trapa natans]